MRAAQLFPPVLGALFLALYIWCHQGLFASGENPAMPGGEVDSAAWAVPTIVLEVVAGEFKGLLADLLALEVGSRLGGEVETVPRVDWDTVIRLFRHSQRLDPYFLQTAMVAEGWLPWTAQRVPETMELLTVAAQYRSWDWHPLYFLGFNSYYFLRDSGAAGKYFLAASKVPNAPPFLAILGARLAQRGGETAAAIAMLRAMLAEKGESEPGYEDLRQRLAALEGSLVLETAVKEYGNKYGRQPENLENLVTSGVLGRLPDNPYKLAYCLDSAGIIYFDKPDCR